MVGGHQNWHGSRDMTKPLSGTVWHLWASTCYDQSICQIWSQEYKRWYKRTKIRWFGVVWESLKVTANRTIWHSSYKFLLAFHINYVPILHRFVAVGSFVWSKIAAFNLPHFYLAPLLGWLHCNFTKILGVRNRQSLGYCTFSHFDTISACYG